MAISQPTPIPATAQSQIAFQLKSPTNSGAMVDVSISVNFPDSTADPTLTEAQKNALTQKLVDFFAGMPQIIPPVSGTKTYLVQQTITPNGA